MSSTASRILPPDQAAREQALDARRSFLVQAPAGSGKTDLLTRRFLRLLAEVDDPGQIVAITFTKAAAAEMRHRILGELERAARPDREADSEPADEFSMESLAANALARSRALAWNLIDLPNQLRITTIDAFCREIALQQPLVSPLGSGLDIAENARDLYRRAARRVLEQLGTADAALRSAIESLLLWRDNGWQEMEDLLVEMLAKRDRWMQGFVLDREQDWHALRERLERPFARAVRTHLLRLNALLERAPGAREEALALAQFGCEQTSGALYGELAELAEFPQGTFDNSEAIEAARQACACLAKLLLSDGNFRQRVDKRHGFPADAKPQKERLMTLIAALSRVRGMEEELQEIASLPPARYSEEDWAIVQACFELLRQAAGQLRVVFAEQGAADYTEIAQIALSVLKGEEGIPGEAALAVADRIRHLLVDEFQDTSRRQHELLRRLVAAWPDRDGRTCFVVGDPMQSIYFFRDADAELFPRVKTSGLEIAGDHPLLFDYVPLEANFRTAHDLVAALNSAFDAIFNVQDGSGIAFAPALPARSSVALDSARQTPPLQVHCTFMPALKRGGSADRAQKERVRAEREEALRRKVEEVVALIRAHVPRIEAARAAGQKYRIAVLGRARRALAPIAEALRSESIPFLALDLEELADRPEILDAVSLARALLNPHDRVAWLGVLRAPWCALSLADLHLLVSADDPALQLRHIPELLRERAGLLGSEARAAVEHVCDAAEFAATQRAARPSLALGSWLEQVWLRLGGDRCVDANGRANLNLLWSSLDKLRAGEQDLLGPAFDAALKELKALPDPHADSECGVQLMTIHSAKGLEFEVVIVPELQARSGGGNRDLLAWLERGLAESDDPEEVTEFLVAPVQSKGADAGSTRKFVSQERSRREEQEMRRLFYVAATRAREELHLFARPEFTTNADGMRELSRPANCLLQTGWPALETEVRRQFDQWDRQASPGREEGTLEQVAAADAENLIVMPAPGRPARLHRIPAALLPASSSSVTSAAEAISGMGASPAYLRHEGGLRSRALGMAVHALLERLAELVAQSGWDAALTALAGVSPGIVAQARAAGMERSEAERIAAQALEIAAMVSQDSAGRWILSPHCDAASEMRWAGVTDKGLRQVQVDRVFRASAEPHQTGDETWWIIDYKTAHPEKSDPETALPGLRALFAPQLDIYARVLRQMHGADVAVRAGLFYPRMMRFDWWEI